MVWAHWDEFSSRLILKDPPVKKEKKVGKYKRNHHSNGSTLSDHFPVQKCFCPRSSHRLTAAASTVWPQTQPWRRTDSQTSQGLGSPYLKSPSLRPGSYCTHTSPPLPWQQWETSSLICPNSKLMAPARRWEVLFLSELIQPCNVWVKVLQHHTRAGERKDEDEWKGGW